MWHGGFCTWGIQTGPFAACWADFLPLNFHLFDFHTGESNYLLPQREENEGKMRKRDSPKSGWDRGVSVHVAFKLDWNSNISGVQLFVLSKTFKMIYNTKPGCTTDFYREHDLDNILTVFRVNLTTARVNSWMNNDIISTCFYCSWAIIHKYAFSSDSDHTFSRGCTLNRCRCSQSLKKD